MMPGDLDGISASKEIRDFEESRKHARTPIIVQTASNSVETRAKCLEVGCDNVLSKPIDLKMIDGIRTFLRNLSSGKSN